LLPLCVILLVNSTGEKERRRGEEREGKVGRSHDKHLTNTEETLIPIKNTYSKAKLNKN